MGASKAWADLGTYCAFFCFSSAVLGRAQILGWLSGLGGQAGWLGRAQIRSRDFFLQHSC